MESSGQRAVVAVFPTSDRAEAASQRLHRIGLADQDIEVGTPAPGRYACEVRDEGTDIGRGAMIGMIVGVPVGSIIAVGVLMTMVPGVLEAGVSGVVLSIVIGAYWGIFFGGLGGVVPVVLAHANDHDAYEVQPGSTETVVVAHVTSKVEAARKTLQKSGARAFLRQVPATYSAGEVSAAA